MGWFCLALSACSVAVMLAVSARANRVLRRFDRLPMQWSFSGVTWFAPRRAALLILPLLAMPILIGTAIGLLLAPPADAASVVITVAAMAAGLIAIQLLHLFLIHRWALSQKPETGEFR